MTLFSYTKTVLMDGLKHGQQVLMLLEKISQTCTSPTYSHKQDYLNQSSTNDTTKISPFYLRYGHQPKFLPDPYIKTSIPATDEFLDVLLAIQYMASKAIIESRSSQETYANRRR